MDTVMNIVNAYWVYFIVVLALIMKVLNLMTVHFSEKKGLVKYCLFLIDLFDLFKSTPIPPRK